ncbi:hypothetical protein RRG08_032815 [Elysia crispata]|uniref:Uncharacterized protein n=1 Tax=Elysia crispata TaxID=231223 RepID=A0AAE0Z2N8_9GAST|nr:hypothetical protein RRG08_032815 [Elysia crispata]
MLSTCVELNKPEFESLTVKTQEQEGKGGVKEGWDGSGGGSMPSFPFMPELMDIKSTGRNRLKYAEFLARGVRLSLSRSPGTGFRISRQASGTSCDGNYFANI